MKYEDYRFGLAVQHSDANFANMPFLPYLVGSHRKLQKLFLMADICSDLVRCSDHHGVCMSGVAARIYNWGGGGQASGVGYARCRRLCIEVCSADQSARSAEIFFRLHFSVIRMGSRGTFVLCTVRSRCMRIDAAPDQQLDSRTSQG